MSTPETLTRELAALDDALAGRPVDPDLADLAELAAVLGVSVSNAGTQLHRAMTKLREAVEHA